MKCCLPGRVCVRPEGEVYLDVTCVRPEGAICLDMTWVRPEKCCLLGRDVCVLSTRKWRVFVLKVISTGLTCVRPKKCCLSRDVVHSQNCCCEKPVTICSFKTRYRKTVAPNSGEKRHFCLWSCFVKFVFIYSAYWVSHRSCPLSKYSLLLLSMSLLFL